MSMLKTGPFVPFPTQSLRHPQPILPYPGGDGGAWLVLYLTARVQTTLVMVTAGSTSLPTKGEGGVTMRGFNGQVAVLGIRH